MDKRLTATMEDYLEAILALKKKKKVVRVKDIAHTLGVRLPTVTSMLQSLGEKGLVEHERYEHVELTPEGMEAAEEVYRRHKILKDFLEKVLGIDSLKAEEDACRMEHAVSNETVDRLVKFIEFILLCPRGGKEWIELFHQFCQEGLPRTKCITHIKDFIKTLEKKAKAIEEGQEVLLRKEVKTLKLEELSPGKKGKITKIKGKGGIQRRLLDMGVVPGEVIEIERVAPLGDPVKIKIKGYHLSLRKEEAEKVYVEEI